MNVKVKQICRYRNPLTNLVMGVVIYSIDRSSGKANVWNQREFVVDLDQLSPYPVNVYIPSTSDSTSIKAGSGIVGLPMTKENASSDGWMAKCYGSENSVKCYYEGRGPSIEDRIHNAYGRMVMAYPTIARSVLPESSLIVVGTYDGETLEILPEQKAAFDAYVTTSRERI
jgi:hypothetical protein